MATYLELFALQKDSDLQDKIAVAVTKKAQTLIDAASPTTAQIDWANATIENPKSRVPALLNYLLAKNSEATVVTIQAVDDEDIQTAVDAAVDALIDGGVS